jgi:membrane fusion protein, multidrug efflux system
LPQIKDALQECGTLAGDAALGKGSKMLRMILLVLVVAAVGAGYWLLSRPEPVTVAPVVRGDAAEIVYATGVVEPKTWAKVAPLVRERIVELCGCEGEQVARDDVLARLDDRESQAMLEELTARQRFTLRELDRLRNLASRNVTTLQELERAESEAAQLEASIAGQRTRLESYVLRSPSEGVVLRQDGEMGEIAEPGTVLFWVGQPRPLRIVADVNEEDVPRVAVGQRTLVSADAFAGRALEASVASITPKGDPVSKTYRVRFDLPDDTPLMIGMTVEVNIVARVSEDTLLAPVGAVADGAVWLVEDGVARRREVTTGIAGTGAIEVTGGLAEGAQVIVPAPQNLRDGARVTADPAAAP